MSLMSLVACIYDAFYFYCVSCFLIRYISCHWTNQIFSMISLMNLVMTPGPLVRTFSALFLCVLMITLEVLVFWGLTFLHQQESIPKVVDSLKCFGSQIPYFTSKFENQFYSYSRSQNLPRSLQPL